MKVFYPSIILLFVLISSQSIYSQDWESVAELTGENATLHHPVTFSIDGYGYVVTGSSQGVSGTKTFRRYDPRLDEWTTLEDFPGPARGFAYGTAGNGKAYLGFGRQAEPSKYLNDLWEYDPITNIWKELAECPCLGRTHPAFIQTDEYIFVGLGGSGKNLKDWWAYNIKDNTWEQKEDLPGFARHHPYYFSIDNIAYVGFGHGSEGAPRIYNDFYQFDPTTDKWTQLNDFPGEGRVAGTQFGYGNKGYILSGQGDNHKNFEVGEFWEYEPTNDSWVQLLSHPHSGRWAPGSFLIDNDVYLMCGLSDDRLENDMWKYSLEHVVTKVVEPSNLSLSIHPNPSNDYIIINSTIDDINEISIYNQFGQKLIQSSNQKINVEQLVPGTYYLSIGNIDNFLVKSFSIIRP